MGSFLRSVRRSPLALVPLNFPDCSRVFVNAYLSIEERLEHFKPQY